MAAYLYGRQSTFIAAKSKASADSISMPDDYHKSRVPVLSAADAMYSTAVRAKDIILVNKVRGSEGSIKYIYYVPSMNVRLFSYGPLDMHTPR